jgi:hypothetical protein
MIEPVDAGLPIGEAAARLGITVPALRKRIRRGSIHAHKVNGHWSVSLPAEVDAGSPAGSGRGQVDAGGDAVIAEVRARVADQQDRIAFLQRLTEHQAGVIADLTRRVPELPTGRTTSSPDPSIEPEAAAPPVLFPVPAPAPHRRPWWLWRWRR